jgi:L-alanine-DL-glutamate epimerase-like enolase superfamily enzyme
MRITDVTVTLWKWKDIPPTRYTLTLASSKSGQSHMGLVHITTDEGVDGYAFLGSALRDAEDYAPYLIKYMKPMLIGEDPLARERIWQTLMRRFRGQQLYSICALDVALWDLAGRHAGMPIHRLMGSYRDSVPAYASSYVLESPEAYAEQALLIKEAGWSAY